MVNAQYVQATRKSQVRALLSWVSAAWLGMSWLGWVVASLPLTLVTQALSHGLCTGSGVGEHPTPATQSCSFLVARHTALLLGPQQSSAGNDSWGHQDSSLKKPENRPEKISNPVPYSNIETVLL